MEWERVLLLINMLIRAIKKVERVYVCWGGKQISHATGIFPINQSNFFQVLLMVENSKAAASLIYND